ncbi:MAG: HAD family phosphatase [Lentimicrobiaceae bacterium]|jgi:beta-phosphoglucomutase family hydrolase|nr:HAD family phosphatase [Lentimicrobiaceae bacterium]MDD4597800.1 HAD family phosphatase [Lentimicrobiaceae bacterium]MDY0025481.1 HAD family phosphatase [Lentimicrobium sp.]HAH58806.1 HAD family phosphatase [Bacteroidales bacterium]
MKQDLAVIFDMDGVLVDNAHYHFLAWQKFCKRHGKSFDLISFRERLFGCSNAEHLKMIFKKPLPATTIAELAAEKELIYRYLYHDNVKPTPGLIPLLMDLKAHNIPMAIATSGEKENVDFVIHEAGLDGFFGAIADASQVKNGKPDPEVFLKAAALLNMKPEYCLVIEDTNKGIDAALKAKMTVIGIATTHHKAELTEAHQVIENFTELSANSIIQLMKTQLI